MKTVGEILRLSVDYLKAKDPTFLRRDVEVLIASILGYKRLDLYLNTERPLQEEELRKVAHFRPAETTAEVKTKEPNQFGLYDMLGNVWEAMANRHEADSESREFRGGSWYNGLRFVRAALRFVFRPDLWVNNLGGFRLLRPQASSKYRKILTRKCPTLSG